MLRVSRELERHGVAGRPDCTSVSFGRGRCPKCGCLFETVCTAVVRGTAASKEDCREVLGLCEHMSDRPMAAHLRARRSFRLGPATVRNARGAMRDTVKPHNARIPGRIGEEPHHRNELVKRSGGGGGGTILESATRAASPKFVTVLGACTKRLVYLRFRTSRSKATMRATYIDFVRVSATVDGYEG